MADGVGRRHGAVAGSADHVQPLVDQHVQHARRASGVVGIVAIDQDIDVGIDISEHPAHDMALAL